MEVDVLSLWLTFSLSTTFGLLVSLFTLHSHSFYCPQRSIDCLHIDSSSFTDLCLRDNGSLHERSCYREYNSLCVCVCCVCLCAYVQACMYVSSPSMDGTLILTQLTGHF